MEPDIVVAAILLVVTVGLRYFLFWMSRMAQRDYIEAARKRAGM